MITGSIVALVTPMDIDGNIDWSSLERLLDMHVDAGTAAVGVVGTTGESSTLSVPEHCQLIRHCVDYVSGRIPVIAGTGGNATREAIELTAAAADVGADACLLVTPYYNKPTQQGLYQHFKAIAEAVVVPQILYNVPGRTSVDMSNDTVARLVDLDNIVGIKDATGDVDRGRKLIESCGDRIAVYSGDDPTAIELMLAGGHGNISVTANVAPALMAELCRLAMAGEKQAARAIDARLAAVNRALFVESNPIPVKWALYRRGLIEQGLRLPLTQLDPKYHAALEAALKEADL